MTTQTSPRPTSASDLAHAHDHVRLEFAVAERDDRLAEIEREKVLRDPGFGKTFTDHMVKAVWTLGEGWHDAEVTAYGPLLIDPASAVLHYAQEIFEGMKAYRHADGSVWTFRPEANAARFKDRKSTRLNSSHVEISYAVFCLKKKKRTKRTPIVHNTLCM